ncbi:hypothetical protein, partial [Desulfovibrio piger]|uniref:hypothetical protein n=1 Tax=Desulfovibrio piger TaxID=901 RepID=UPI0026F00C84
WVFLFYASPVLRFNLQSAGEKVLPPPDPPTFPKPFIQVPDGCRDMKILLALLVLRQGLFVFGEGRLNGAFCEDDGCFFCRTGCFPSCGLLGGCSYELRVA